MQHKVQNMNKTELDLPTTPLQNLQNDQQQSVTFSTVWTPSIQIKWTKCIR